MVGEKNETLILEPNTGQCANENIRPLGEVDCEIPHWLERRMKTLDPRGGFVRFHIDWRGERNISYKGVETSP